jgi:hypothetical protein
MVVTQIQLGTGVMPAAGAMADQLTATTRRGMVPICVDQVSKATPLASMLMANAHFGSGGVSSITQAAKFGTAVAVQASDFSGRFNLPGDTPTIQNATWNWKLSVIPIQMFGVEMAVQEDHAIIDLQASRYDDAGTAFGAYESTALYGNVTDTTQVLGLPAAIDDGTNLNSYAGISRSSLPSWKSYYKSVATGTYPTRANMAGFIQAITKQAGGEKPKGVFVGFMTWLSLMQDYQGQEVYQVVPGNNFVGSDTPNSGFEALMVIGVPVFCDPYCPEGDAWFINPKYLNMYIHKNVGFTPSPFESMLANGQWAFVSCIFVMRELVCIKPSAQGHVTNLSFAA